MRNILCTIPFKCGYTFAMISIEASGENKEILWTNFNLLIR
ncbi:hypothetical protein ACFOZ1_16310 [Gracilibacillus marinus]|uniref:Uncharacterized protein n=1 Tax=Gracilibacillus marinus TaxID=630535 RepID=A0ABV8VZJ3_9BACI